MMALLSFAALLGSLQVGMGHRVRPGGDDGWETDFVGSLQRRDGGHLDQQILAHQAVDDEEGVRRIGAARK